MLRKAGIIVDSISFTCFYGDVVLLESDKGYHDGNKDCRAWISYIVFTEREEALSEFKQVVIESVQSVAIQLTPKAVKTAYLMHSGGVELPMYLDSAVFWVSRTDHSVPKPIL